MAGLCFGFADELAGGSPLGRCLSGFLSGFWGIRLLFQLFFYDREVRRRHRLCDVLFLITFLYLVVLSRNAVSRPARPRG